MMKKRKLSKELDQVVEAGEDDYSPKKSGLQPAGTFTDTLEDQRQQDLDIMINSLDKSIAKGDEEVKLISEDEHSHAFEDSFTEKGSSPLQIFDKSTYGSPLQRDENNGANPLHDSAQKGTIQVLLSR